MSRLSYSHIITDEADTHLSNLINRYSESKTPFLFIIDFDKQKPVVIPLDEVHRHNILFDFKGFKNYSAGDNKVSGNDFIFNKYPVSYNEYKRKYDIVQEHLMKGNSYLLNLTLPTPIETSLSLKDIFYRSNAPYKLFYEDKFVVFSPESFICIKNDVISSFPMKGTINKQIPEAEKLILSDEKELAEHSTIVDLIRNDLSIVATEVEVKRFRYISHIQTHNSELLQVSSEIAGKVRKELRNKLGTILSLTLPAGSISGAPKQKTIEIIKEAEQYERGYFTGVFGYFDGKDMESAVMIRFIEQSGDKLYFKSGGGITIYSDPESEYKELIDKVYVPIVRDAEGYRPQAAKHILS